MPACHCWLVQQCWGSKYYVGGKGAPVQTGAALRADWQAA
jgi:hypothetical protein